MSFRSRLLLFFVIIVVIPMVAVALVLFSITADSETGKADAAIAQGMRTAFAVYSDDRARAGNELHTVAADPQLTAALSRHDHSAVRARLAAIAARSRGARRIAVYDDSRTLVAATGAADAVASAAAAPAPGGRRIGLVAISVTRASDYTRQVKRLTGLDVLVAVANRP
ncbi:MAG TPA: hypothetical protein VGC98_16490, partial [Thermoleophilaceae bacterium]